MTTTRCFRSLRPWGAAFLWCLLASCSADFKSGETKCSLTGECPEGFTCAAGICISGAASGSDAAADSAGGQGGGTPASGGGSGGGASSGGGGGAASGGSGGGGGAASGGMTGTGGAIGAGGKELAGTGGGGGMQDAGGGSADANTMADAMPEMITCSDPKFPQPCPANNGLPAVCGTVEADCSTLTRCGSDELELCRKGEVVSCGYPNRCSPITNMCPIPTRPTLTKFCPGNGGAGPVCTSPDVDCATLIACSGVAFTCAQGRKPDCKYFPVNPCGPIDNKCAADKKFCPAIKGVGPDCYDKDVDCASITLCGNVPVVCSGTGFKVDCTKPTGLQCVKGK